MRREAFRTAYRAALWTLRNKGLSSLSIALPGDIADRKIVYALLADGGHLAGGAGEGLSPTRSNPVTWPMHQATSSTSRF